MKIWAPQSYREADADQKAAVCNGVGPAGVLNKIVPDTLYGLRVTEAGNIHDWMYSEAAIGAKTPGQLVKLRQRADTVFLRNMIVLILQHDDITGWTGRRFTGLRLYRAVTYFLAVWRMGDRFIGR